MGDTRTIVKEPPQGKRSLFGATLDLAMKVFGLLVFSMVVSILIEWVGMRFYYPDSGYHHAEQMLKNELQNLKGSVSGQQHNDTLINVASAKVGSVIDRVFVDSGAIAWVESLRHRDPNDGEIVATAKMLMAQGYHYIMAAIFIISMFLVRLTILVLSLPVFLLFGLVGLADGLMQRDLRRWCGGTESGYIYHWSKKFALPVLFMAWFVYLAIPESVHPNLIILPFAALFGLVLMIMFSKFKKYL